MRNLVALTIGLAVFFFFAVSNISFCGQEINPALLDLLKKHQFIQTGGINLWYGISRHQIPLKIAPKLLPISNEGFFLRSSSGSRSIINTFGKAIFLTRQHSSQKRPSLGEPNLLLKKQPPVLSQIFAHYIRGILYDSENKIEQAIEEYLVANRLDSTIAAIHRKLALDYIKLSQYEKAEEELLILKQLRPEDESTYVLLAHFYLAQKQFAKATSEYEELLARKPEDLEILASLADLYVMQDKLEEAILVYQELLQEKPDSAQIHFNLGIIFTKMNKLKEAQAQFKKVLEVEPNYLQAELGLALLGEINQDFPEAIKHYQQALNIDPLNINVYHRLAQTYYHDKRISDAIHQYEFILQLNPDDIDAYLELAYIYLGEEQFKQCIDTLEEAKGHKANWKAVAESRPLTADELEQLRSSKEVKLYLVLGLAYTQNNQEQQAIAAYEQAIAAQPENSLGYFYLGAMFERSGKRSKAYDALKKALELDDQNPDTLNYLGYMYAEDEINLGQAEELVNKALAIDPDNGAYIDSLGWIYFKKGMIDQALVEIERASSLLEDAEVFEHLGDIYRVKGQLEKASQAWGKALELEPERETVKERLNKLQEKPH